ncbi:nuclear body protein SP140-like protein isoform X1 [Megalobrama amblycephala]|uniref:nuclear body protein SP140-like protein isoform X1 n=2 Tax=Megalobrama amblycephala TaxID=75352 RepID=UPI0020140157|nr:nuclear body protein SP140-like protein isoform X1 [Megalobrama amblycephala]
MGASGQLDPLDFLTNEDLQYFLHRKKTEISCIDQPHALFTQLRDHDLMTEELFERVKTIRSREQKQKRIYEVLDRLEKEKSQCMHQFWRCVFEEHILQLYPTLRKLRNSLLDGSFRFYGNSLDVETWMENSEGKGEKGKETRKRNKDDGISDSEDSDEPGPSSACKRTRKKPAKSPSFTSSVKKGDKQKIGKRPVNKSQVSVNCGDKVGTFYWDKQSKGEKCILSEGRWFSPSAFEKFGGKERYKNWKSSIRSGNTTLKKLIEEKDLQTPPMERKKRKCVPKCMKKLFEDDDDEEEEEEEDEVEDEVEDDEEEDDDGHDDDDDEEDNLSVFQAHSLPVTCVSLTGTLHKSRFASGSRGKCIRTEESWFTPEEFVKQEPTLTDGHWKKDILCHGKTINFLIKEEILHIHSFLCECVECSDDPENLMDQKNDDMCYICDFGGDLVCCDECPRAFHSRCHLPAVDEDSLGEWICTFCVLRTSQQWRDSSSMTEQEALNAPVSQYRLHCHYLLLYVYKEDIKEVFVKDPRQTVFRYSEFISKPMWLDRIKVKLESDQYQTVGVFVSDFQLIFSNCRTFNKDNRFGQMGARLKEMFEKEFQKIFTIQK